MVMVKEKSCSSPARLKFHIGWIHHLLRKKNNAERFGAGAPVYFTSPWNTWQLQQILEEPWRHWTGNTSQSWSLERSHGPNIGMEICGSRAQWTFGNDGSHGEQRYRADTYGVSWLLQWLVQICGQPWWLIVSWGPCLRWIYGRFAWYGPCCSVKWSRVNDVEASMFLLLY